MPAGLVGTVMLTIRGRVSPAFGTSGCRMSGKQS